METVGSWLEKTQRRFDVAGLSSARLDAQLILGATLDRDRAWLLAHSDHTLDDNMLEELSRQVKRRLKREPIAYITGHVEFYGRTFFVNESVLIPRPESEQLVEAALKLVNEGQKVIDIGTGSGCIGITIALEKPHAAVHASDISKAALDTAVRNARYHEAKLNFHVSDLLRSVPGKFDVLVANLPYVSQSWAVSPEANFEPEQALFAGEDGLTIYKRLLAQLDTKLKPSSQVLIEADPRQSLDLQRMADDFNLEFTRHSDYVFGFKLKSGD